MAAITKVAKNSKRGANPGERRGGRTKGTPNKKTGAIIKAAKDSGLMPLDYMLDVMRREIPKNTPAEVEVAMEGMRFEAAKAAAPYLHPKLSSVEHTGKGGEPINMALTVAFGK